MNILCGNVHKAALLRFVCGFVRNNGNLTDSEVQCKFPLGELNVRTSPLPNFVQV